MPHTEEPYRWDEKVRRPFPDLRRHHRRALAEYPFGMVMAGCCGLTSVVAFLSGPLAVGAHALARRLEELYRPAGARRGAARAGFDHACCFAPLVRWAASEHGGKRLALAPDPARLTDRSRVPRVGVLHRGSGLPVAWAVRAADRKGSWGGVWRDLLGRLKKAALGEGWAVLVLTDRGPEPRALSRAIVVPLGWRPLMRAKAAGKSRPEGWHEGHPASAFARPPGGAGPGPGWRTRRATGWPARPWRAGREGTGRRGRS